MFKVLKVIVLGISVLLLILPAYAQEAPKEQIKGLDEQVQEIKTDVLSIAAELNQLEEKLLYPVRHPDRNFCVSGRGGKVPA